MNKLSLAKANAEAKKALQAFQDASDLYADKAKPYVYMGQIVLGKPMRPEALLDFAAFREIDKAWRKLERAEGKLRDAYVRLALAQHDHFVKGDRDD